MKFQTSALTGMMLDFACAQFDSHCEGLTWEFRGDHYVGLHSEDGEPSHVVTIITEAPFARMLEICREYKLQHQLVYSPSTNWAQGGPIFEREKLCVGTKHQCDPEYVPLIDPSVSSWARTTAGGYLSYGPTPLIAAMRAFVASKVGDSIDLPR